MIATMSNGEPFIKKSNNSKENIGHCNKSKQKILKSLAKIDLPRAPNCNKRLKLQARFY